MENPVFPGLPTFLAQLFSFLLVVFILNRLLYEPISNMLSERAKKIKDAIDMAENTRLEAERMLKEHRSNMDEAKQEAQKVKDQAVQVAASMREELVQKAREEAERIVQKTLAEVEKEKTKALEEIQAKVADLVILTASKVVDQSFKKEDHIKLIDTYLSDLSGVSGGKEN